MEYVYLLLLLGVVIALCVLINHMTDRLKIPSLLLFIGLGIVFGVLLRPKIGNFTDYALGNVVCSICLVFVIFTADSERTIRKRSLLRRVRCFSRRSARL